MAPGSRADVSYIIRDLDSSAFDVDDEVGFYGVGGLRIGAGDRVHFLVAPPSLAI